MNISIENKNKLAPLDEKINNLDRKIKKILAPHIPAEIYFPIGNFLFFIRD